MNSEEQIALFDDYLRDNLSDQEKKEFQDRLENDVQFKKSFEEYTSLSMKIKDGAEYRQLRTKLDKIHDDLYGNNRSFIKKPLFYIPLAIAASIAVLLMIFPLNFMEQGEMADTSATEDVIYTEEENANMIEEGADEIGGTAEEVEMDSEKNVTYNSDSTYQDDLTPTLISEKPIANAVVISTDGLFVTSLSALGSRDTFFLQNKCVNAVFKAWIKVTDEVNNLAILKCSKEDAAKLKYGPTLLGTVPGKTDEEGILMNRSDTVFSKRKGTVLYRENCSQNAFTFITYMEMEENLLGRPLFLEGRFMLGVMVKTEADNRTTCVVPAERIIEVMNDHMMDNELNIAASTKESAIKVDPIEFVFTVH